ncbi:MAG: CHAT domain-containing protein [Bacteroidia bacterium]|nr:CHAT domain-containing protein [Bacteroidia bacterium]
MLVQILRFVCLLLLLIPSLNSLAQESFRQRLEIVEELLDDENKFDEAIHLAERIAQEAGEADSIEVVLIAYQDIAYAWSVRRKLTEFLPYEKQMLPFFKENHPDVLELMIILGNAYRQIGELYKADLYYQRVIQRVKNSFPKKEKDNINISALVNRGVILAQVGDYKEARVNYRYALDILEEILLKSKDRALLNLKASIYTNIGQSYFEEGKKDLSISHYHKSLESRKLVFSSPDRLIRDYLNLASAYLEFGDLQEAEEIIQKVLSIEGVGELEKGRAFRFLGEIYLTRQEWENSHRVLDSAGHYYENFPGRKSYIGRLWQMRGRSFLAQGQSSRKAIEAYQEALSFFIDNYEPKENTDLPRNPSLENGRFLFETLTGLARAWKQSFQQGQNQTDLIQAYETYQVALQTIDSLRMELKSRSAKYFWGENLHEVIEESIQLCLELESLSGDETWNAKAYEFSNAGKAFTLKEKLMKRILIRFKKTNQNLLFIETEVEQSLARLQKELILAEKDDPEKVASLRTKILEVRQTLWAWQDSLRAGNPDFNQLLSSSLDIKAGQIQTKLEPDQVIWDYFWGKNEVYRFGVSRDKIEAQKIGKVEKIEEAVDTFMTCLRNPQWIKEFAFSQEGKGVFANTSAKLFRLICPQGENLPPKVEIVADGPLVRLPFSCLIEDEPSSYSDYSELPFLLYKTEFKYAYGKGLESTKKSDHFSTNYLGIAPSYAPNEVLQKLDVRYGPNTLKYNKKEVASASKLMGGNSFLGAEALKDSFLKYAPEARILHLAMHGYIDEHRPQYSKLAFGTEGGAKDLFGYEVSNLVLGAEMVVLSACETALGKYQRGEGNLSMARYFREAGCQEVLMTLWSIDDKATSQLLERFFEYYKEGNSASLALKKAKESYLEERDLGHPFYWAAFVLVGEKHEKEPFLPIYVILAIVLPILLGAFVFFRNKLGSKQTG